MSARLSDRWRLTLPIALPSLGGLAYLAAYDAPARLLVINAGALGLALVWAVQALPLPMMLVLGVLALSVFGQPLNSAIVLGLGLGSGALVHVLPDWAEPATPIQIASAEGLAGDGPLVADQSTTATVSNRSGTSPTSARMKSATARVSFRSRTGTGRASGSSP